MKTIKPDGKIVCVGDITPDIMIPYSDTLETVSKIKSGGLCKKIKATLRPGGSIGNAVATLGLLGMDPYIISVVGNDEYGDFLINDLKNCGVCTKYISKQKERMSLILAVLDKSGERTLYLYNGPGAKYPQITSSQIPEDLISDIGWLHTNGFANDSIVEYMEKCRKAGAVVSFDLNLRIEDHGFEPERRTRIERAVSACDVLLGSGQEEFAPLTGITDLYKAALSLATDGRVVVARDGSNPMMVFEEDKFYTIPVRRVKTVNTVGSGDIFNGGFIAACVLGLCIEEAVAWGSLCSASAISNPVPRTIPTRSELKQRAKWILKSIE